MAVLLLFILFIPGVIILIEFLCFIFSGERLVGDSFSQVLDISVMIITPVVYLLVSDMGKVNDCCNESAFFSPQHRLSIYVLIVICLAAFFFSRYRKEAAPPLVEMIVNVVLLAGIVLNIFIAFQEGSGLWILGNIPIIILLIYMLIKNHRLIMDQLQSNPSEARSPGNSILLRILHLHPLLKMPLLLILCIPVLVLAACLLLIFGQKPDSIIRAFTETYHHGLSQWNYMCDNVQCGGHYLCSVAAKGHKKIVKPIRLGTRAGNPIICNRQLLVSNAFEELLEQKCPAIHRAIRKQYNHVGDFVHRYYGVFNIKWVSDIVYIGMKPLEWMFLLTLYTFDKHPENRIAQQYLSKQDRQQLQKKPGIL